MSDMVPHDSGGALKKVAARFPIYQIDFTAVASGKRIATTKRRIRWRFGFSNKEALENGETGTSCRGEEHDVTIVWSVTSGKRLILADGREVHYSTNRASLLEYSWTMRGNHVLKVIAHAAPQLSATPGFRQYDLHIDGQSFFNMPKVYELGIRGPIASHAPVPGDYSQAYRTSRRMPQQYVEGAPRNQHEEEEDLQRAIQASIQESQTHLSKPRIQPESKLPALAPAPSGRAPPEYITTPAPAPDMEMIDLLDFGTSDEFVAPPVAAAPAPYYAPPTPGYAPPPPPYNAPPVAPPQESYAMVPAPVPSQNQWSGAPAPYASSNPNPADPFGFGGAPDDPFAPKPVVRTFTDVHSDILKNYSSENPSNGPASPFSPVSQNGSFAQQQTEFNGTGNAPDPNLDTHNGEVPEQEDNNPISLAMKKLINFDDISSPAHENKLTMNPFEDEKDKKRDEKQTKSRPMPPVAVAPSTGPQPSLSQIKNVRPAEEKRSVMQAPAYAQDPGMHAGALVVHGQQNNGYGPPPISQTGTGFGVGAQMNAGGYGQYGQPQQTYAQPPQGYGQPQQFQQAPPPPPQAYGAQPGYAPQHPTYNNY
eukprot:CAMPEP_0198304282 /NCGR_PEP_ID=MMETSP1449-20131203/57319_1 /TAXON_ID=420275 /ORGANISM="Attheya septentrionalis, Strain CCMP2084" /LENGTH=591 /DNA_ID=CAMNT_0044006801 /DNA_START=61 /DNA_END=1836 /DNA_ORIENTATION=+